MVGKNVDGDPTGSIASASAARGATLSAVDLPYARAAAAEVLDKGGEDASAPWENPRTGARGTVTPINAAYSQDGSVCREVLASYVNGETESWLQGQACRVRQGGWEIRNLRPWKRG
jgi:surface antigen